MLKSKRRRHSLLTSKWLQLVSWTSVIQQVAAEPEDLRSEGFMRSLCLALLWVLIRDSQSLTFVLGPSLRWAGHVNIEHLTAGGRWRAGQSFGSLVQARDRQGPAPRRVPVCPVQRNLKPGSASCSIAAMGVGLWLETLQPDRVFGITGARQQYSHVFAELGAEAEVDEGVVEAGRLGEEAGEDAGEIGNVESPR